MNPSKFTQIDIPASDFFEIEKSMCNVIFFRSYVMTMTKNNKKSDISSKKKTGVKKITKVVTAIDLKQKELEPNARNLRFYSSFVKDNSNYDVNFQINNYEEAIQNNELAEMFIKEKILELKLDIKSYAYDEDSQIDNTEGIAEKDYYRIGYDSAVQNNYGFDRMPNDEFRLEILPYYAKGRLHAYLLNFLRKKLKSIEFSPKKNIISSNGQKIRCLCKQEQIGYVFSLLERCGFLSLKSDDGTSSYASSAKILCSAFEFYNDKNEIIENPQQNVERVINYKRNVLTQANRERLKDRLFKIEVSKNS